MKLFVAVAATLLFAALAQSPGRACTFIVPVIEQFPCPPRMAGATAPTLAVILAQAKADLSANQFRPECLATMLDDQLGQSEERLLLMLGARTTGCWRNLRCRRSPGRRGTTGCHGRGMSGRAAERRYYSAVFIWLCR
jgi:hypothetical protein